MPRCKDCGREIPLGKKYCQKCNHRRLETLRKYGTEFKFGDEIK